MDYTAKANKLTSKSYNYIKVNWFEFSYPGDLFTVLIDA